MRIETFKKAGKIAGRVYDFGGIALKGAITAAILAVVVISAHQEGTFVPEGETSPIEQFLLENPEPVEGLGDSIKNLEAPLQEKVVPKPRLKKEKQTRLQVSRLCHQYDELVLKYFGKAKFKLRKAQMHKESSCNKDAVGGVGEIGLFQVKQSTCDGMKVKGNLFDPETNIRCAARYSRWLCEEMGHCEIIPNLVAYNAGGDGVKRVRNLSMHPYARGIFKILGLRA
jgi:hypothetical protein